MRELKKAGYWEGAPEVCPPKGDVFDRDTPKLSTKLRGRPMSVMLILRSLAGMAWKAVRRLPEPPASDRSPSLTIGAVVMPNNNPETPATQGSLRSPRSEAVNGILYMAQELLIARFALSRCMDKLDLVQLLDVFVEVSETLDGRTAPNPPRLITPRDQKW
jgi:hypothetical protein